MSFWRILFSYQFVIALIIVLDVVYDICLFVFPVALRFLINSITYGKIKGWHFFLYWSLLLCVAQVIKGITFFFKEYMNVWLSEQLIRRYRQEIFDFLLDRVHYILIEKDWGQVLSYLSQDLERLKRFVSLGLLEAGHSILVLLVATILLGSINPEFMFLTICGSILLVLIYRYANTRLTDYLTEARLQYSSLFAKVSEILRGWLVIVGYGLEHRYKKDFSSLQDKLVSSYLKANRLGIFLHLLADLLLSALLVVLLVFGGWTVLKGGMKLGDLVAFYISTGLVFQPLLRLASVNLLWQEARVSLKRINSFYASSKEQVMEVDLINKLKPRDLKGKVVFMDVIFSYPTLEKKRHPIGPISFTVSPGELAVITGPNGSGKTTILKLILGLYWPNSGCVYIDNFNIKDLDKNYLRRHISLVFQDDYFFRGTIKENLKLVNPEAKDEDLLLVCKLVGLDQLLEKLPQGLETILLEDAKNLSSGQRKRLSIARALLRKPRILLLDEPFANLDSTAELQMLTNIAEKLKNKMTIFITTNLKLDLLYSISDVVITLPSQNEVVR